MNELVFQVEFLSDIVLPATSNTEGNIEQLDFIPGSNFLGMVAKEYGQFDDFKVFHSGSVRFGDAHVLSGGKQTYKMPLSYFHKKLDSKSIYNHHFLEKNDFLPEEKGGLGQLKQMRKGYITQDNVLTELDYVYSQKSAYDKRLRKSADSKMYGYTALPSGSKWQFTVKYDETVSSKDLSLIKETLLNSTKLGKSRSSQYGQVQILLAGDNEEIQNESGLKNVYLYANSRLALTDKEGNPSYDLVSLLEKSENISIDYEKTQIRTSTFTPYNRARATKDSQRVCINKGSVIVLKEIAQQEDLDILKSGVGAYLSEGFGELLINPSFLEEKGKISIKKEVETDADAPTDQRKRISKTFQNETVQFLSNRHNHTIDTLDIAKNVSEFIEKNKDIYGENMNSQWGSIRALCSHYKESEIEAAVKEYISTGVAKTKWSGSRESKLLEAIHNISDKLTFVKLLSIQMPKIKVKGEEND